MDLLIRSSIGRLSRSRTAAPQREPAPTSTESLSRRAESFIFSRSLTEVSGVDPLCLDERPPVHGELLLDVGIREPSVACLAPPRAPGVPDQEGTGRLLPRRVAVLDLAAVVVAHRHDSVAAHELVTCERNGDLPGCRSLVDAAVDREAEHRWQPRRE